MPNHLADSLSPYLRQHADNPVDWYPWGEPALEKARQEEKPIFLSIGYSACHWCHVMAHESFEDDALAAYLNMFQRQLLAFIDRQMSGTLRTWTACTCPRWWLSPAMAAGPCRSS